MKKLLAGIIVGFTVALLAGPMAFAGSEQAAPVQAPLLAPVGTAFTYQGFITDGGSPANGNYNLRFELHDSSTVDSQVGTTLTKSAVAVSDGYFTVELDFGDVFDGTALWLEIEVQGPSDPSYTVLSPRQALNAAPFALYALNIPDHDHFGETWSGIATYGLRVDNDGTSGSLYGIYGQTSSPNGYGVRGYSEASSGDTVGVYGSAPVSPDGRGVYGVSRYGIYGESWNTDGYGVYGEAMTSSGTNYGVYGESNSSSGYGGYFVNNSSDGAALYAVGDGEARGDATLIVENTETVGGVAAYITANSTYATAHIYNGGTGEVLYLQNGSADELGIGGGDFIRAVNEPEADIQFRVASNGDVYTDGSYHCAASINDVPLLPTAAAIGLNENALDPCLQDSTPADFAEMLPAQGDPEPGDVLVIGLDGNLLQSSASYQTTVVGVHSYRPSYLGNAQFADEDGYVPLAMLGVVPVKASAENGAIQPGDLLVSSSTPGHAMKAGENPPQGTVIGKALSALDADTGYIQMIVMLQ